MPLNFSYHFRRSLARLREFCGRKSQIKSWQWVALPLLGGLLLALFFWPLPAGLLAPVQPVSTQILDRHGELLFATADRGSQKILTAVELPPQFVKVLLATEDRTFYAHGGVSLRGIARAAWANFRAGKIVAGGSTLTQQLVRTRLRLARGSYFAKLREAYLAWRLERIRTKSEILTDYLNTAYFGHRAYGLAAASATYFGVPPDQLSLAQSALLIGLLQAPVRLDPFENLPAATARQRVVLAQLKSLGLEKAELLAAAEAEKIVLAAPRISALAPHFVQWLLATRGAELANAAAVRTTLDAGLQRTTSQIVARQLEKLRDKNVTSAAVVVLDAKAGDVLALTGSADFFDRKKDGQVNVALAARQPGSALKPFVYALALSSGFTAASTVADVETQFFTASGNPYLPRNYDFGYHGLVRLREALANSYNVAATRVAAAVGVEKILSFLRAAGLSTLNKSAEHYGVALALGDGEVRLLELARAYALFPRGGRTLTIRTFLADPPAPAGQPLLDPRVAWLVADILSDNSARAAEFGLESPLAFDFPVGAKTGTTRNSRDNWTLGFTGDRVVGVWVGNADNSPMRGTSGVTGAGPIFHEVLLAATAGHRPSGLPRPLGLEQHTVCRLSGLLPTPLCPATVDEFFLAGTAPTQPDHIFQAVKIDTRNGLRANDSCPAEFVTTETFTIFPPEVRAWARENGYREPPRRFSPACAGETAESAPLTIRSPHAGDEILRDPTIPPEHQKLTLTAESAASVTAGEWWVDGQFFARAVAPDFRAAWPLALGRHTFTLRAGGQQAWVTVHVN